MRHLFILLGVAPALLAACAAQPPQIGATDPFELRAAPDGTTYRLDKRTGKTAVLDRGMYKELAEPGMPLLVVGRIYRAEDGRASFKYTGGGRLEPWGLDRYLIPDGPPPKQLQ